MSKWTRRAAATMLGLGLIMGAGAVNAEPADALTKSGRVTYQLGRFNSYDRCVAATEAKLRQLGFLGGSRPYSSWCYGPINVPGTYMYKWHGGVWVQY